MPRPARRAPRALIASLVLATAVPAVASAAPQINSAPPTYTNNPNVSFGWIETDVLDVYEWALTGTPGGVVDPISNPGTPLQVGANLSAGPDGVYTFTVKGQVSGLSDQAAVTLDRVAPDSIVASVAPAVPASGWFNAATASVTVTIDCQTGGGSPLSGTWPRQAVLTATGTASAGNQCADAAGNVDGTPATQLIQIDKAAPSVVRAIIPANPNGTNGWYRGGNVAVALNCADSGGSGLLAPTTPCGTTNLNADGVYTATTGESVFPGGIPQLGGASVSDVAGNGTTIAASGVTLKRDTQAPTTPVLVSVGGVANVQRPTLAWAQAQDAPKNNDTSITPSGMQAYRLTLQPQIPGGNPIVIPYNATMPFQGQVTFQVPSDLTNGATYNWRVAALDAAGNVSAQSAPDSFKVDLAAPNAPTLTGGPTPGSSTSATSPTFTFAGVPGALFNWTLKDSNGQQVAASPGNTASATAQVGPLKDDTYTLAVKQIIAGNVESVTATVLFTVDTGAPGAPAVIQSPGTTTNVQPSFSWRGAEPDGSFTWEVTGPGGAVVAGPSTISATSVQIPALPAGAFVFRVRQRDRAGNLGDWSAPEPFTIIASAGGTTTVPTNRRVPQTLNSRKLKPKRGAKVSPKKVVLDWPRLRSASLYNVQLFRVDGQRYTKVLGTFTRGSLYIVKKKHLRPNTRYVWRVWPYIARTRSYTRKALGISYFDTRAR